MNGWKLGGPNSTEYMCIQLRINPSSNPILGFVSLLVASVMINNCHTRFCFDDMTVCSEVDKRLPNPNPLSQWRTICWQRNGNLSFVFRERNEPDRRLGWSVPRYSRNIIGVHVLPWMMGINRDSYMQVLDF